MKRIRLRFSLKMMFAAFTVVAVASFFLALPTLRAARFARFVREGQIEQAEAMLPASMETMSDYRQAVRGDRVATVESLTFQKLTTIDALSQDRLIPRAERIATLQPLTFQQLIRGERRVIVGQAWGGGTVEFIVTYSSISAGENWFNQF